jgi:hypothetical protein
MKKYFLSLILMVFFAGNAQALEITKLSASTSGLGDMSLQSSNNVTITGGTISIPTLNVSSGVVVNSASNGLIQIFDVSSNAKVTLSSTGNSEIVGSLKVDDLKQGIYHRFYHLENVASFNVLLADLTTLNSSVVIVVNIIENTAAVEYGYFRAWIAARNNYSWTVDGSGVDPIVAMVGYLSEPTIQFVGSGDIQTLEISGLTAGAVNVEVIVSVMGGASISWL